MTWSYSDENVTLLTQPTGYVYRLSPLSGESVEEWTAQDIGDCALKTMYKIHRSDWSDLRQSIQLRLFSEVPESDCGDTGVTPYWSTISRLQQR